jgi:hypothetical protein
MTLLHADNFDSLATVGSKYSANAVFTLDNSIVRFPGQSIKVHYIYYFGYVFTGPKSEIYVGIAQYIADTRFQDSDVIYFRGLSEANFVIKSTSVVNMYSLWTQAGTLYSFKPKTYAWNFFEVKFKASASSSAGDLIVKLNNETIYSCGAGLDLLHTSNVADTSTYAVNFGGVGMSSSLYTYYDDLYICDNNGSVNNTFLGDCRIETLYPNGNGNSSDFMGSDSNQTDNYLLVDEATHNSDTDYVYDSVVDQVDLYTFGNLTGTIGTIHGIVVEPVLRKTDAGTRTARTIIRQNSTNYESSEIFPSTTYVPYPTIWETDPDTSSAWTETGVNSAEYGITVES